MIPRRQPSAAAAYRCIEGEGRRETLSMNGVRTDNQRGLNRTDFLGGA
jgi:hypothetical protein